MIAQTQWEYLVVYTKEEHEHWGPMGAIRVKRFGDTEAMLAKLGADGWELAGVSLGVLYMKRPRSR